jgi:uncharacterized lipoprotein YmbA
MKALAVVVGALLLCGCGSSPKTQFFALDPVDGAHVAQAKPIQVAAVHIPAALDRQEIVREKAPGQLDMESPNRWGAPFDEMVQRTLTQDLARRMPERDVVFPNEPAPPGTLKVVVDILAFGSDPSGQVKFDGSWSLVPQGSDEATVDRHVQLTDASGNDPASQVMAMSKVLGELADQIAGAAGKS